MIWISFYLLQCMLYFCYPWYCTASESNEVICNGSKPSISNERQRVATSRTALPTSSIADPRHLEHLIATRSTLLRAIRTRNRDPRPPPEYDYASGSDPRVPIGDAFAFTFVAGLPCSSAPASNLSQSHSYSRCSSSPASRLLHMSSLTNA